MAIARKSSAEKLKEKLDKDTKMLKSQIETIQKSEKDMLE